MSVTINYYLLISKDEPPRWLSGKESVCQYRRCGRCGFDPWVRKIPWRRNWQPTLALSLGEYCGQRRLAGYSPRGHKESATTEETRHARWLLYFIKSHPSNFLGQSILKEVNHTWTRGNSEELGTEHIGITGRNSISEL